jgi:C1A family cysteine protease
MAEYDYDEVRANEATGFSGFGGHLLAQMEGGPDGAAEDLEAASEEGGGYVATLASLGIEDAEQLVAIAAIPAVRGELQSVLGLKNKGLQTLLSRVQGALPAERAAMVSAPASKDLGLGVLPPTPEIIAAAEATAVQMEAEAAAASLPAAINLIPYMPPIRNQRSRGTCVSFTLTALNEYILRRTGNSQDLSEQHLYYETKLIDGASNGCGTWQAKAVLVLRDRGQCRELVWPYNPNPPCNNHGTRPANARSDALRYRLNTLSVPPRNVQTYKSHMYKRRPVGLSIPVYDSWYLSSETRRSGRITMRVGNEPANGGHAVLLVGYQDSASSPGGGYFIVRNSWGTTDWGYQCPYGAGYGTIPYQYITNEAWEAFTAPVPGITSESDEDGGDEQLPTGKSTVTIEVSPNIKITITSS